MQYLLEHPLPVPVRKIAQAFQISARSVYYNLDRIAYLLKSEGIHMELARRQGVWIEDAQRVREILQRALLSDDEAGWEILESERRVLKVIVVLMENALRPVQSFITADDIRCVLDVGRSTVLKDLAAAKQWLQEQNITVISKPHCGMYLTGEEAAIRDAILNFLSDHLDIAQAYTGQVLESYPENDRKHEERIVRNFWDQLMRGQPLAAYRAFSDACASKLRIVYSDRAVALQTAYLAVTKCRLEQGCSIAMSEGEKRRITRRWEFHVLQEELFRVEPMLGVEISRDELYGLAKVFLCSDIIRRMFLPSEEILQDDFERMAYDFVHTLSEQFAQPMTADHRLLSGIASRFRILALHPAPAFRQYAWGEQICQQRPEICRAVVQALAVLPPSLAQAVDEGEIRCLAGHVYGCLERCRVKKKRRYQGLILSNEGFGSTSLLRARIEAEFPQVTMLGSWGERELETMDLLGVDLIFSTMDLPAMRLIPWVKVSPLLIQEDIGRIRGALSRIADAERQGAAQQTGREFLHTAFSERRISVANRPMEREEAIRFAGELLRRDGYVLPAYIDAMVETFQMHGDYAVLTSGVAMSYAKAQDGALKTGFSLLALQEPVDFGVKASNPVRLLFALSATDDAAYLTAMKFFARLLSGRASIHRLLQLDTPEQLYQELTAT